MKSLSLIISMAAAQSLVEAQDGNVESRPPYVPALHGTAERAPEVKHYPSAPPRQITILPQFFSNSYESTPGFSFESSSPSTSPSYGQDRFDVRVTEERNRNDHPYYTTPRVRVQSATGNFLLDATFERTFRQEDERRPLPIPPPAQSSQQLITAIVPVGKMFMFAEYRTSPITTSGSKINEFELDGVAGGGGVQVSLWGGLCRVGLAYVQGNVRSEPYSSTVSSHPLAPPPEPPSGGGDDVVIIAPSEPGLGSPDEPPGPPLDPGFGYPGIVVPEESATTFSTRTSGTVQVIEIDLSLTILEGQIPLSNGWTIYVTSGILLNLEHVTLNVAGETLAGWVLAPGAFIEGGFQFGRSVKTFIRGAGSYGFGFGDIETELLATMFAGVEISF